MPEPARALTVLVVDDNEANRALAQHTLEDEGYRVVLCDGGKAAIEAFPRERPDCVLLDVRMPEVDGFEVCERIRATPGGAETPVIFLTALRDVDTFDHALRSGGDDFLTKPVSPTELVVRVQTAIKLKQLGAEVREHYELLKHQRDALQRLQLQKERLTAFIVHDLKNPVNSMDLHAQVLLRMRDLPERAKESVAQIRAEARQLTRMIMNLLDLSKADEGKLTANKSDVDLGALVAEVLNEHEESARAHEVSLRSDVSVDRMFADADLVRRLLSNLIDNAIRHAPAETTVTVGVAAANDGIELRIADQGSGIAPEMRARIFDAFVQLDREHDPSAARTGRGLGLAFCKLAVDAHGGKIWVEDGAPGALFCVRFPP